jgi:hypothetical protein
MFHDPSPSLNTHPRDERTAYAEQREAARERHCPEWEPGFPGETLPDALLRAAVKLDAVARDVYPADKAQEWLDGARACRFAASELRNAKG